MKSIFINLLAVAIALAGVFISRHLLKNYHMRRDADAPAAQAPAPRAR